MTASAQKVSRDIRFDSLEEEFEKDIWDGRNIPGARYAAWDSKHLLNFTLIPSPFRAISKRYIRFQLTYRSLRNCSWRIRYIRLFLEFLLARYPDCDTLHNLTRGDIEAYLTYLRSTKGQKNAQGQTIGAEHAYRAIGFLRHFLEYLERIDAEQAPLLPPRKLVWPEDGGKLPPRNYELFKHLPETILLQLEENMHHLSPTYFPVVMLLRASGWRISDILNLRHDTCLEHTAGGWWLCGDIPKTEVLHHKVPISSEVATVVSAQVTCAKELFSEQENPARYLFPARSQQRRGRPLAATNVQDALNRLAKKYGIKDDNGSIFHFGTHVFRHTKGVELINNGMSLTHVQKWFAHFSPDMTLAYARLLDVTRRKEWEEAFAKGAVRIDLEGRPQVVKTEQLESEQDIEWEHIRHNLDAVRLADGYCFKPKKANCPTQDSPCYTCRHFCTTPDFLSQFEKQERELHDLIALGEKAGSEIWVERNTQKLNRVLPVIQILRDGNLHHPAGKVMREYTPEERVKRA